MGEACLEVIVTMWSTDHTKLEALAHEQASLQSGTAHLCVVSRENFYELDADHDPGVYGARFVFEGPTRESVARIA